MNGVGDPNMSEQRIEIIEHDGEIELVDLGRQSRPSLIIPQDLVPGAEGSDYAVPTLESTAHLVT
jgi:hypothetical protein